MSQFRQRNRAMAQTVDIVNGLMSTACNVLKEWRVQREYIAHKTSLHCVVYRASILCRTPTFLHLSMSPSLRVASFDIGA